MTYVIIIILLLFDEKRDNSEQLHTKSNDPDSKYPRDSKVLTYHASLYTLQWRHNGRDGVSDHQPHDDCLLNRLFRRR